MLPAGTEFAVVVGNTLQGRSLCVGRPDETCVIARATSKASWSDVLECCGLIGDGQPFKSRTQARKNGFDGFVPDGWSERVFGKMRYRLYVLNHEE